MSYETLLRRVDAAGVYHMPHGDADALAVAAEANGFVVFRVDLQGARDKGQMLDAIARTLAFPEWFGHGLDALLDCLCDLAWRPAEGYLVLLEHCDGIHGHRESDFVDMIEVFAAAADEWREQGVAFWCLVDMLADGVAWLPSVA